MSVSNSLFLTVLPPRSLEGVGWTLRVLSERDYASPVALVDHFAGLGFTVEANAEGGGTVTLDSDDHVFTSGLPLGETVRLQDQEALWQVVEDGQVRFEFLAEDVDEDVIPDGGGPRQTVIAGRGTGSVLEWAPVLPLGLPTPVSMTREFEDFPMVVWSQLFFEAQAAGFLDWVSLTFDDFGDSAGVPWAGTAQKLTVNAGDTLLDLLKRWSEQNELSWRMLPGFRLEVRQDPGVHHEDTVVFTQFRSQGEHKRKISRRELANVIYADSGDNGLAIAEDPTSVGKWRRRAAWVSAGDAADASARSMVANTSLTLSKDQRLSRSVRIIPDREGRHPFVDFDLHDWIMVEVADDDTESGARKVLGLAVDIGVDGLVEYEATLQSRFEARAVKTQRILDKLGGSSRSGSGSSVSSPIPVSKALSAVNITDLADVDLTSPSAGSLLQYSGGRWVDVLPNLDFLGDVESAPIPDAGDVALVYDRTAGLWKPGNITASGGGGGGGGGTETVSFIAGDTSGATSGSGYPGATTVLTVRSTLKLTGLDFYAAEAGTYTLKINGGVIGDPVTVAAAGIIPLTFPEVVLGPGSHTVGITPTSGTKKVRYRSAASITYVGAGYDFTAAGWNEFAGAYTIPFIYRGTGEVMQPLGTVLASQKWGTGAAVAVTAAAQFLPAAAMPDLVFSLYATADVELSGMFYMQTSALNDFVWALSADDWVTWYEVDYYAKSAAATAWPAGWLVAGGKTRPTGDGNYQTVPLVPALLNLPAGTYRVRLYKKGTTAMSIAEYAGYALARRV